MQILVIKIYFFQVDSSQPLQIFAFNSTQIENDNFKISTFA